VFYDNWVARDINGTALENAPFESVFHHAASADRFQRHLPVQVQSCWNGVAVLDPAPFYAPAPVRFRMARIAQNECSASECSLICNDYWDAGYGRILMVPRVKLAYDHVRAVRGSSATRGLTQRAARVRHHPPQPEEPDCDPRVHAPWRPAG
jgi:alpha-1,3-mannosyltransferase